MVLLLELVVVEVVEVVVAVVAVVAVVVAVVAVVETGADFMGGVTPTWAKTLVLASRIFSVARCQSLSLSNVVSANNLLVTCWKI